MPDISNQNYPRGIPYQAPARPRPSDRRPLLTALAVLAIVFVTVAATVVVLRKTTAHPPGDRDPADDRQTEARAGAEKPAPSPKPAPLDKTARGRLLGALGTLSAAHVYQGYLNIGLLADGVENEAYTKVEGEQMLAKVVDFIDRADRQLEIVKQTTGLDADDQGNVEEIQDLTALLRRQASALRAYWATGDREQIARYHEAREKAWKGLSEVFEPQ